MFDIKLLLISKINEIYVKENELNINTPKNIVSNGNDLNLLEEVIYTTKIINSLSNNNFKVESSVLKFSDEKQINSILFDEENALVNSSNEYNKILSAIKNNNKRLKKENSLINSNLKILELSIKDFNIFVSLDEEINNSNYNIVFRYLPLKRKNIILIFALPFGSINELLLTINYDIVETISEIIILNQVSDNKNNLQRIILIFSNQNSADNFYYEYASKNYYSTTEHLYCCFIEDIYIENIITTEENLENVKEKEIINTCREFIIPYKSLITSCPNCLEKIDNQITKINSINSSFLD